MTYAEKVIEAAKLLHDFAAEQDEYSFVDTRQVDWLKDLKRLREYAEDMKAEEGAHKEKVAEPHKLDSIRGRLTCILTDGRTVYKVYR